MSPRTPVVIVDDHPLVAVALRAALRDDGIDAEYLDPRVGTGLAVALARTRSGLAVVDLDLADGPDGVALVATVRDAGWDAVLLTGSRDRGRIAAAVAAGALGWMAKESAFEEIVGTVRALAAGEPVFDLGRRAELVAEHHAAQRARSDLDRRWNRLTPRERAILERLVDGKRVAEVARESVVSPATVRTQVRSILAKLEVSSQLEAVALARRAG